MSFSLKGAVFIENTAFPNWNYSFTHSSY